MSNHLINHALKEWAIAVNALCQGKTIMLLRKGGIRETHNKFQVAHNPVLLYPTYEHQKPALLKPEYANQVTPVNSGWHPETVHIAAWANITNILLVTEANKLEVLFPHHIWNNSFASQRFKWKPKQPLYVLLLRTYLLPSVIKIPYISAYGGCNSWIDLGSAISLEKSTPVIEDAEYTLQVETILKLI